MSPAAVVSDPPRRRTGSGHCPAVTGAPVKMLYVARVGRDEPRDTVSHRRREVVLISDARHPRDDEAREALTSGIGTG